ncbi:unnamed protein product [Rotaria sordida]|uniref:Uncharacterized protein n=1 Tax=Rotaria sordida TaxID=392033 RepID=A0A815RX47_9BILA|nr:unnamed protein product [Rotaria sordida]CAF4206620.1 unnamed protein product [Rotaria sordida]
MVKSSSTGTPISLATSSFSISFQPTIASARRTNTSTQSPTSKKSTSSNDSISESRLFVDEDSSDKNKVELDKINNLETCNINSVENDFDVDSENDDSLEKPAKNINDSVKVFERHLFHLGDSQMDYSLHKFLSSLINDHETNQRSSVFIQPQYPVNISDPQISTLFSSKITYYSTAFIGGIRFTISNYCHKRSTDDSSIVYRASDEVHFGPIHRIFTVDDGEVLFQIFSLSSSFDFTCEVNDEQFYYDEIEIGTITSETTTCIIKAEQIIEKRAFYLQSNGRATFIRFPNLEEHS